MKYSILILLFIIVISINGYSWVTIYKHINEEDAALTSEEREITTVSHLKKPFKNTKSPASFFDAHKPLILFIVTCYISFVVTFF
ncbi:hypothetical protein [Bacillus taeanensis]|uniref:Uncharacterized protein n=1 Tax=Bacillus taeanensis TaxID=273032 RepID=A0A366XPD4_9BACI|nr:hypothetical protein [Bacillus taeanensis]RBW67972.1 hypothetical protein DS031_19395 [Bacillus taeanensis]